MVYEIVVADSAIEDAKGYAQFILEQSGGITAVDTWMTGLERLIESLAEMPTRFKTIEEGDAFMIELRQALYHSHRVIYHVDEVNRVVHVVRIYHGARKSLVSTDIPAS